MTLLAIETACGPASVALMRDGAVHAEAISDDPRGHVEFLMPAIERICALRELDEIAVDIGPGAFTGLRAGVATAKALAHTLGIPVRPVGSLEVVAASAPGARWAVVDAGRGRAYAQGPGHPAALWDAAELAAAIGADPVAGWVSFDLDGCAWVRRARPHARDVAAHAGAPAPAASIEPVYLRGAGRAIDWEGRGAVIERPGRVKI